MQKCGIGPLASRRLHFYMAKLYLYMKIIGNCCSSKQLQNKKQSPLLRQQTTNIAYNIEKREKVRSYASL